MIVQKINIILKGLRIMPNYSHIRGRLWVIGNTEGNLIDDVDTDQIYHNAHLAETNIEEMGKYALGNLEGWRDFPQKAAAGDILVVGRNFGAGSSRQQAVDCFRSLGIACIIGESFAPIYKRNAINSGFSLVSCPGIGKTGLKNKDEVEVNSETGEILNPANGALIIRAQAFSRVQLDILQKGHLFAYGKKLEEKK